MFLLVTDVLERPALSSGAKTGVLGNFIFLQLLKIPAQVQNIKESRYIYEGQSKISESCFIADQPLLVLVVFVYTRI